MALGLGKLVKLAKGGVSFDELAELLSALGVDIEIQPCDVPGPEVETLWRLADEPGGKVFVLHGLARGGARLHGVLVVAPLLPVVGVAVA